MKTPKDLREEHLALGREIIDKAVALSQKMMTVCENESQFNVVLATCLIVSTWEKYNPDMLKKCMILVEILKGKNQNDIPNDDSKPNKQGEH